MRDLPLPPVETPTSLGWDTFFTLILSLLLCGGVPAALFYHLTPEPPWWGLVGVGLGGIAASYLLGYLMHRRSSQCSTLGGWRDELFRHSDDEGAGLLLLVAGAWGLLVLLTCGLYNALHQVSVDASPDRRRLQMQAILAVLAQERNRLYEPRELAQLLRQNQNQTTLTELQRNLTLLSTHGLVARSRTGQVQLHPQAEL